MRSAVFSIITILSLVSFGVAAQTDVEKDVVMYDPLFWKDQLSLKTTQSRRIEEINSNFYENLRRLREESTDHSELKKHLDEGLQERSEKIYEALFPKQRKKLEKIIEKNPVTVSAP